MRHIIPSLVAPQRKAAFCLAYLPLFFVFVAILDYDWRSIRLDLVVVKVKTSTHVSNGTTFLDAVGLYVCCDCRTFVEK